MPEYIDIHAHLGFPEYDTDREAVLRRMQEERVWAITVGVDAKSSEREVQLAREHEGIFAIIGQHPVDVPDEAFNVGFYESLISDPKVVAVGECGLDYFRLKGDESSLVAEKLRQREVFEAQIDLAVRYDKPLMIHCRAAYEDTLQMLESAAQKHGEKIRGNVHFFAGDVSVAQRFLSLGFTLSFTGVITFTKEYDEVVRYAPLSMIMSETDSPFVAPAPYRGKRNEPVYVKEVVARIAELRYEPLETVRAVMVQNAFRSFGLDLAK